MAARKTQPDLDFDDDLDLGDLDDLLQSDNDDDILGKSKPKKPAASSGAPPITTTEAPSSPLSVATRTTTHDTDAGSSRTGLRPMPLNQDADKNIRRASAPTFGALEDRPSGALGLSIMQNISASGTSLDVPKTGRRSTAGASTSALDGIKKSNSWDTEEDSLGLLGVSVGAKRGEDAPAAPWMGSKSAGNVSVGAGASRGASPAPGLDHPTGFSASASIRSASPSSMHAAVAEKPSLPWAKETSSPSLAPPAPTAAGAGRRTSSAVVAKPKPSGGPLAESDDDMDLLDRMGLGDGGGGGRRSVSGGGPASAASGTGSIPSFLSKTTTPAATGPAGGGTGSLASSPALASRSVEFGRRGASMSAGTGGGESVFGGGGSGYSPSLAHSELSFSKPRTDGAASIASGSSGSGGKAGGGGGGGGDDFLPSFLLDSSGGGRRRRTMPNMPTATAASTKLASGLPFLEEDEDKPSPVASGPPSRPLSSGLPFLDVPAGLGGSAGRLQDAGGGGGGGTGLSFLDKFKSASSGTVDGRRSEYGRGDTGTVSSVSSGALDSAARNKGGSDGLPFLNPTPKFMEKEKKEKDAKSIQFADEKDDAASTKTPKTKANTPEPSAKKESNSDPKSESGESSNSESESEKASRKSKKAKDAKKRSSKKEEPKKSKLEKSTVASGGRKSTASKASDPKRSATKTPTPPTKKTAKPAPKTSEEDVDEATEPSEAPKKGGKDLDADESQLDATQSSSIQSLSPLSSDSPLSLSASDGGADDLSSVGAKPSKPAPAAAPRRESVVTKGGATKGSRELEERIRELEQSLEDEKRKRREAEEEREVWKRKAEDAEAESRKARAELKETEAKHAEERVRMAEKHAEEKQAIEKAKEEEIQAVKESMREEAEKRLEEQKNSVAEAQKVELDKLRVTHEHALTEMKAKHLDEIAKLVTNAEATRQLESLATKMDESSKFVDSIQQKIHGEYISSLKDREESLTAREKQLKDLQTHLFIVRRNLDEERAEHRASMEKQAHELDESRRRLEEERRANEESRLALEEQIVIARSERDAAHHQLHRERLEFLKLRDGWALERKRAESKASEERRQLAMDKAVLDARRDAIAALESDLRRAKEREEAQISADRVVLDKEIHLLGLKRDELHREAAQLRAEKLALEALKARSVAEIEAFEKARETAEKEVRHALTIREEIVKERQKAETFNLEAKRIMSELEGSRAEIKRDATELEEQRSYLEELKARLIDERIQLAEERGTGPFPTRRAWDRERHAPRTPPSPSRPAPPLKPSLASNPVSSRSTTDDSPRPRSPPLLRVPSVSHRHKTSGSFAPARSPPPASNAAAAAALASNAKFLAEVEVAEKYAEQSLRKAEGMGDLEARKAEVRMDAIIEGFKHAQLDLMEQREFLDAQSKFVRMPAVPFRVGIK
ncbi:hypothetical protein HDU96_002894 [Phlyctochytrium bullatum]|nr:hypothetical protein HDU96_002894 [Phlyctochytrium bullatum]